MSIGTTEAKGGQTNLSTTHEHQVITVVVRWKKTKRPEKDVRFRWQDVFQVAHLGATMIYMMKIVDS